MEDKGTLMNEVGVELNAGTWLHGGAALLRTVRTFTAATKVTAANMGSIWR